jgi:hypothetical protein
MRVFLSWSGPVSRAVATALHDWIPLVIQDARPFISTGDIEKGKRWSDVIGDELNNAAYGIICVTKENLNAPWLHFEAGAISKAIDKSYVSPFLFNVPPSDVHGPLQQFQFTVYAQEDIWGLMRSVNSRLAEEQRLADEVLRREFDMWWGDLKAKLDQIAAQQSDQTHTAYPWLYTLEDLTRITAKAKASVWWITPNPFEYVLTPTLRQAIRDALARGVKFTFMVPESDRSEGAEHQLKRLAALTQPDSVVIAEIPSADFHRAAVTDYVIIDPDAETMQLFLELPLQERLYWISVVNQESAGGFVERFRDLAEHAGTHPATASSIGMKPVTPTPAGEPPR